MVPWWQALAARWFGFHMDCMMTRRLFALLAAPFALLFPGASRATAPDCSAHAGRWGGVLGEGDAALRLVLEIDEAGRPTLVSVDQGGARIPATGGSCSAGEVRLEFAAVRGRLEASLETAGEAPAFSGSWNQGQAMPIRLVRLSADQTAPARPVVDYPPLREAVPQARAQSRASALGAAWRGRDRADIVVDGTRIPGGAAVLPTDLWHIGSITKSMTGTLLARLVQRGILSWDQPVAEALGDAGITVHEQLRSVTLHQLVTGRSGLASNIDMVRFLSFSRPDPDPVASRARYAKAMLEGAPEAAPGSGFIYPNAGFIVAGFLAERATGRSWEALMREEVFAPLGLTSAGFGPPDPARAPQGLAPGMLGGAPRPARGYADNPPVMGPAGTVHMTLDDLTRFGLAHARGAAGEGDSAYLPQDAWRFLHAAPAGSDYAVGWVRQGPDRIWHNGSNTLWLAELRVDLAAGIAAAAAANLADTDRPVGAALEAAAQAAARAG